MINTEPLKRLRIYLGISCISASILMLEIIVTRIFSVKLYYHYAFMVISLAMLGSGASGIYVSVFPSYFKREHLARQLHRFNALYTLSIPLVLLLILRLDFQFNFSLSQVGKIFLLYSIPAIPFFFGGMCVSVAMTHLAERAHSLYFFDLVGAASGCLLVIPLLNWLGGPESMLATAALAAFASWLFPPDANSDVLLPASFRKWLPIAVMLLVGLGLLYSSQIPLLEIRYVKGRNEAGILFTKWNSFSRITVVQVNNNPKDTWIIMDGDAGTLLPNFDGDLSKWEYLESRVSSLAYHLKPNARALIIGPGGGIDVLSALRLGGKEITGVEINPITVRDVMLKRFKEFTGGLYDRPEVQVVVEEGRSFIRRTPKRYDVIQATLVDTWAATAAGAFALTENNLYTVEAFKDYISKLEPDGILTFTRWNLEPPQQDLRLVSLTRQAMQESGIAEPENHIAIVRERKRNEAAECNFIFKKSPFTEQEVRLMEQLCISYGLDILYSPLTRPVNPFTRLVTAKDPADFYASYPFDVTPPRDNSPFFFHTVRLKQLWKALFLPWESKKTNIGVLLLFIVFFVAGLLVLLFILAPLYKYSRQQLKGRPAVICVSYFICLGIGFILIEMTLVQKFILFLGQPVYALSLVLFSILLFSGLGSAATSRLPQKDTRRKIRWACLLITALILSYIIIFPTLLYRYVGWPLYLKASMVVGLLAPLSFLMGIPMPLGIRWLRNTSPMLIPWAWGLNGSASVLGSILTVLIAINFGFNQALYAAIVFYLLASMIASRQ